MAPIPRYLVNHVFFACVIGFACAVVLSFWEPLPWGLQASDAMIFGGLAYVVREKMQSGLVMPDGKWKRDWTWPLAVTATLAALGRFLI